MTNYFKKQKELVREKQRELLSTDKRHFRSELEAIRKVQSMTSIKCDKDRKSMNYYKGLRERDEADNVYQKQMLY